MNLPNKITVFRLLATPVALLAFYIDFPLHITITLLIFILAIITDPLDGYLARKFKMVTKLGTFLDPLSDKLLIGGFLIALTVTGDIYPLWLILLMLGRDAIVSGFRNFSASQNIFVRAIIWGKIKALLQTISIIIGILSLAIKRGELISFSQYNSELTDMAQVFLITALIVSIYGMGVLLYENWDLVMKKFRNDE